MMETGAVDEARPPTLSVIINNYNHKRFLPVAIDSVLRLPMDLSQVVVVDDGSTDGSQEVIGRYGAAVTPLLQSNMGQLQACLNALPLTTGEYVYILDADDFLDDAFAEHVPAALVNRPSKVQFRLASADAKGEPLASVFPDFPPDYNSARMLSDIVAWGLYVCPPTSGNVFRRDVLERVANTEISYETAVDGLAVYLAPTMGEVVTLPLPLAHYRLHGSNLHQQHVLSSQRLRKEVGRTKARLAQFAALTGLQNPYETTGAPGMVREWRMMIDIAEQRRPRFSDAIGFLQGLWRSHHRIKAKLVLTAWAVVVSLSPVALSRMVCDWRLSPLNRPRWLNAWVIGSQKTPAA